MTRQSAEYRAYPWSAGSSEPMTGKARSTTWDGEDVEVTGECTPTMLQSTYTADYDPNHKTCFPDLCGSGRESGQYLRAASGQSVKPGPGGRRFLGTSSASVSVAAPTTGPSARRASARQRVWEKVETRARFHPPRRKLKPWKRSGRTPNAPSGGWMSTRTPSRRDPPGPGRNDLENMNRPDHP